jgi:tetratricopeptide (TPR) repeat protein
VGLGTIRVNVRNATGAPLSGHAIVRLSQRVGSVTYTESTIDAASVDFKGLPVGDYVIEVTSAGYHTATEEASLLSPTNVTQVYILLRLESAPGAAVGSGPPVLAPKAHKEVQDAIQALENNNLREAEKHLERAEKMAPGHPEVQYLLGILLAKRNDAKGARARFEKAVSLYTQHAAALGALGRLSFREGDLSGAASAFERALVADARSHENHAALAAILFELKNLDKAKYHAETALDLAGGKLPETRLLLSQILVGQGDRQKAAGVLQQFLVDYPSHRDAETVRRLHAALVSGPAPAPSSGQAQSDVQTASTGAASPNTARVTQAGARVLSMASLTPELAPGAILPAPLEWAPKDIDEVSPAVFRDVTCSQDDVIKRAGQRVADLITHLGDVNAAEKITHTSVDARGRPGRTDAAVFEYMFSYRRPRPGVIWVEEFRDGSRESRMVGGVGTSGFAAMAMVFHPSYSGDFEMKCEGQGSWKGEAVWYVRFQQRDDKAPRMRSFTSERGSAALRFKGRAWITANTFQIVRLETDVISPPKELRFEGEHMVIEYAPVTFKERKQSFWLPASVDIYAYVRGRRWHRNHSLSNYVHFAVDTKYKITDPDVPNDPNKPPPVH